MNEKPTIDLDQLAIIRGLLERQETKVDNIGSKVDLLDTRFRNVEATTENTRIEVQRLTGRVSHLETDVKGLKEKDVTIVRTQSDANLEQQAVVGGIISHVAKLEVAVQAQGETLEGLKKGQSAQTATLATLANALTPYLSEAASAVKRHAWIGKLGFAIGGAIVGAILTWLKDH